MLLDKKYDVAIVGGGVIGLSIAWELLRRGWNVCVIERDQPGKAASWAGAGMIPPGPSKEFWPKATAPEQLAGLSQRLHSQWHERLLNETGIDNGYRQCGSIYLPTESVRLADKIDRFGCLGIEAEVVAPNQLSDLEPALRPSESALFVPAEAQIRNPRHLKALVAACERAGVEIIAEGAVLSCREEGTRMLSVKTEQRSITAEQFCFTTGCWSEEVAEQLGFHVPVAPVRGQIALLKGTSGVLKRIINVGPRYLVPRDDGHVLVGSTMEDAGFAAETTEEGIAELLDFAAEVAPPLAGLATEKSWAGLRPATPDRLPLMGRIEDFTNVWIATGHFRAGLQLSTGTAALMADAISGVPPAISLEAFSASRQSLRCEAL